jgi:hypothetical protein
MTANVLIHEALCFALFYTVFCRAVRSDARVKTDVRFAFFVLGAVSIAGIAAPIVWAHQPSRFDLALLASIVLVQAVTARHWTHGVPEHFLQDKHRPRNRQAQDRKDTL